MEAMENMINNEMVQDVVENVADVIPTTGTMNGFVKNGLIAIAGALIWEGSKFVAKKTVKFVKDKKAAKNEAEDFVDLEEAEEVETK